MFNLKVNSTNRDCIKKAMIGGVGGDNTSHEGEATILMGKGGGSYYVMLLY